MFINDERKKNKLKAVYAAIQNEVNKDKNIDPKFWIAGGAITALYMDYDINDFDVYSNSPNDIYDALLWSDNFELERETENYANFIWMGEKIQIIRNYSVTSTDNIFSHFDFVCCCGAYDGSNLYHHDKFMEDITLKKITINDMHMPIYTMKRLIKYAGRGFSVSNDVIVQVAKEINQMDVEWDSYDIENEDYCRKLFSIFKLDGGAQKDDTDEDVPF
jgi:hypothetical protein